MNTNSNIIQFPNNEKYKNFIRLKNNTISNKTHIMLNISIMTFSILFIPILEVLFLRYMGWGGFINNTDSEFLLTNFLGLSFINLNIMIIYFSRKREVIDHNNFIWTYIRIIPFSDKWIFSLKNTGRMIISKKQYLKLFEY